VLPGAVIGWDMSAALALAAKLNEQMDHSHG